MPTSLKMNENIEVLEKFLKRPATELEKYILEMGYTFALIDQDKKKKVVKL